jgi:polyhydroxyalkanoate synthesis regulator protein
VTIRDFRQRQRRGIGFVVVDTETGADVTRVLLAE